MPGFFDEVEVDIECPTCNRKVSKSLRWIKEHFELTCECGQVIKFDKSNFTGEIEKAERALDDFLGSF